VAAPGGHEERVRGRRRLRRRLPENLRFSLDAVSARRARTARLGRREAAVRLRAGGTLEVFTASPAATIYN